MSAEPGETSSALHMQLQTAACQTTQMDKFQSNTGACPSCRLRTRLFAAQCILELPSDVGSDARHFDLVAAQANPGTPAGVLHVSLCALSHACARAGKCVVHQTRCRCNNTMFS